MTEHDPEGRPLTENDWLAERFEAQRPRLTGLAQRMLGSPAEADDAVQEAWIRLSRTDADAIENLGAWLTTVLSRVCLNVLQSRRAHPEVPLDRDTTEPASDEADDPEHEALLADSIGLALMVVLDTLSPAERVAFVLHDMFGIPFDDIAPIVRRNTAATRQLASRARRRVRNEDPGGETDRLRQAKLVDAFLAAARGGDFDGLVAVLDPDVVLRADATVVATGGAPETRGATPVAELLKVARGAEPALLDGMPAAMWKPDGELRVVFRFSTSAGRISAVELIADPERLAALDL